MSTDAELIEQINDFNKMYYSYVNCANDIIECSSYDDYGSPLDKGAFKINVDAAYNRIVINLKGKEINSSIFNDMSSALTLNGIRSTDYDASYNSIITTNLENVTTRRELDVKIKELQNAHDSIYSEDKKQRDITIFTNITLTALITCGIFYAFSNL